jgi:hypothetical protein
MELRDLGRRPDAAALQAELRPLVDTTGSPCPTSRADRGRTRVDLGTACAHVLALCPRYRLPETTRLSDRLARSAVRG